MSVKTLRTWWWRRVRLSNREICHRCGRPVEAVFLAEDVLWDELIGGPAGIRCIRCFDLMCAERGIIVAWDVHEVVRVAANGSR